MIIERLCGWVIFVGWTICAQAMNNITDYDRLNALIQETTIKKINKDDFKSWYPFVWLGNENPKYCDNLNDALPWEYVDPFIDKKDNDPLTSLVWIGDEPVIAKTEEGSRLWNFEGPRASESPDIVTTFLDIAAFHVNKKIVELNKLIKPVNESLEKDFPQSVSDIKVIYGYPIHQLKNNKEKYPLNISLRAGEESPIMDNISDVNSILEEKYAPISLKTIGIPGLVSYVLFGPWWTGTILSGVTIYNFNTSSKKTDYRVKLQKISNNIKWINGAIQNLEHLRMLQDEPRHDKESLIIYNLDE